ncbi:MAG TPA: Holliday junction branch migration protein RuvA [Thermoanaerobaculia bacterium]|nr:Holliday junction branch migration protein RuvA [Thermoanaerobaculia bacterium]
MIARLSGTLVESRPDRVVLDVNGVGYDVAIPLGTFAVLPATGARATLHVHTVVREDAFLLYGFATASEKDVFEKLLSVSGVGPKVALTVLSGLPIPELVSAIATQNARRLATIPGIGKKLAERLGLELKEKMAGLGLGSVPAAAPPTSAAEDAIAALKNLGYRPAQAEAAVASAAKEVSADDLSALLQAALKGLAK